MAVGEAVGVDVVGAAVGKAVGVDVVGAAVGVLHAHGNSGTRGKRRGQPKRINTCTF